uniref:Superoxide dismutase 1 copper chaperone n=1 Tax=Blastobotrys adeninivorans TaxID=409370 RepID=A0A060T1A1_BLAAD
MTADNTDSFTAVFAVPMHCSDCCNSVTTALKTLERVDNVECDLGKQLVSVTGSAPPSAVVTAIQAIGRDAIVRGTGLPNSAAVAILESHAPEDQKAPVKGLARIVAVSPTQALFDITLNGLPKGTYYPSVRVGGNIFEGAKTCGALYQELGTVEVGEDGSGQTFVKRPISITELIGRGLIVSDHASKIADNSLVGVIARSAGVWQNDKTVCSCSGKTVWEERQDQVGRGLAV